MSFDIYFLPRGRTFAESLDAMEEAAMVDEPPALAEEDGRRWEAIVSALAHLWPAPEQSEGPSYREMSDLERGAQLSMSPGELALSVAYWHTGDDAQAVDGWLREVVGVVEGVTGLVGYDPQSDAAFLESDAGAAAATMDYVGERMASITAPPPKGFLRRLFGPR